METCPKCTERMPADEYHSDIWQLDEGLCLMCGWSEEFGECTYDPRELAGQPIGMFHCPVCGTMQMAGMRHM